MKRIASIQDISCLGRCSLTVALPGISAMGVECAIVPTAVLSAHTVFENITVCDLSDQLLPIARHWQSEKLHLDAIYTGYLASVQHIDDVCTFFDLLGGEDTLLFVDPAMADHGKLYTGFGPEFPAAMAKVVARADVAVPNLTEACLLTGAEYREEYDEAYIRDLLHRLVALGAKRAILTGVSFEAGKVGVVSYDSLTGEYFAYFNEKVPRTFHGTGDIFSSVVMGGLMRGLSMEEALRLAVDYTLECIRITNKDETWYGVEFERAIPMLCERLKDAK